MGIDRPYDDAHDVAPDTSSADAPSTEPPDSHRDSFDAEPDAANYEFRDRATYYAELRAEVEVEYRAAALEQGCEAIQETERNIVTPEMQRIEPEDPQRHLVGFEFRLKGQDRIMEKVTIALEEQPDLTPEEALATVKDPIRYTLEYSEDHYTEGVQADTERLKTSGFELVELRNSWADEEYKGINSRWRVAENDQLFEVQFHTRTSFEAKQLTHTAYERIRDPATPHAEIRELRGFQRDVCATIPIPPGATDIPDYP